VLWIHASNIVRFDQSVREILDVLRVYGRKDPKANVFQLLHNWLSYTSDRPWLIVLDNADDASVLFDKPQISGQPGDAVAGAQSAKARFHYIPQCDHGTVIITSRNKGVAKQLVYSNDIVDIGPMDTEQALRLLEKKLGRWFVEEHAAELAQRLDFMPLALTQAVAYICQVPEWRSIPQYLEKLKACDKSEASVLDTSEGDLRRDPDASNAIILTWQISFDRIREVRPSAADLLSLMSFFDRQAIPAVLLQEKGSSQVNDEVGEGEDTRIENTTADGQKLEKDKDDACADALHKSDADILASKAAEFEKDVVVLRNYSLVSLTTYAKVFEMHRLVQLATRRWLKVAKQLDRWSSHFVSNLDEAFPLSNLDNWTTCQSIFPHTVAVLNVEVAGRETILQQASLLQRSGQYASEMGDYTNGENMEAKALQSREEVLGAEHPDTLRSMDNLADTYSKQGRYDEAEKVQVEVMEKSKEVLGEWHPSTLRSMNNLAFTLRAQGRRQSAYYLISSCAEISQAKLGKNHPDTIAAFTNKARWEADDNSDDTSDESPQGGGGGGGEKGEKVEEEHRGEGEGNDEGGGAPTVVVEDVYASRLDPRGSSNTWNEPQFLWLL
jgi:tetratricopeptide (TPR) repeat protein